MVVLRHRVEEDDDTHSMGSTSVVVDGAGNKGVLTCQWIIIRCFRIHGEEPGL